MEQEKKPGLALIIAMKAKKAKEAEASSSEEEEGKGKFSEIAQDVLDAIKEEDADSLATALKAFVKVLEASEEE